MGAYREQLLRETYGGKIAEPDRNREEEAVSHFGLFKLKFTVCLLIFAGFAYLSLTGQSFFSITPEQIRETVTEDASFVSFLQKTVEKYTLYVYNSIV